MPLSDVAGFVTTAKKLRQGWNLWIDRESVVGATRDVRPLAGHERCPGGRANRLGDVGPLKNYRFIGEFVQVRRMNFRVSVTLQRVGALLIGQEDDEVPGRFGTLRMRRHNHCCAPLLPELSREASQTGE